MARSVVSMGLRHAVITSVTRDDLPDGGAAHWAAVITAVREAAREAAREAEAGAASKGRAEAEAASGSQAETGAASGSRSSERRPSGGRSSERRPGGGRAEAGHAECPGVAIEVLIPDFQGDAAALDVVLAAGPDVVGHNLETVARLTPAVRSRAEYGVSLDVLKRVAERGHVAKSGMMLGLGETPDEVLRAMDDLRQAGVALLTLGQYLQPTRAHLPVAEYVHPDMFEFYKQQALARGFSHVASGPLVRSSYMAHVAYEALR